MIGLLDPGDDRQAQVFPAGPALAKDIVLQEGEDRFHGGVVGQAPTVPIEPVRPWSRNVRT